MKLQSLTRLLPTWKNAALAVLSATLLILAFPDFEFWFLAWFALIPLFWAIERESESTVKSFILGWIFGTYFFFGTCWWLTFAPITYAAFHPVLAYFLLFCATLIVGLFPGMFAAILSVFFRRFGNYAIVSAPFIWVFFEFLRYWLTGNNWNSIGYSQSFQPRTVQHAAFGGMLFVGFLVALLNSLVSLWFLKIKNFYLLIIAVLLFCVITDVPKITFDYDNLFLPKRSDARIIAIQPNVPMSGLTYEKWAQLRQKHVQLAESALQKLTTGNRKPTTVIFPESPMNFAYDEDPEFQEFISAFAARNNVHVLFNAAEPDLSNKKYFNSAVMIDPQGKKIAQYDKIYLVPFGESVPAPLQSIVPAFVGSFSYGNEYDLLPLGDAKAGVMICFESHFGSLSREYVLKGADILIEMTNDGYLGPTPVLRQHLANAVFRAVETGRPVLRVTNVGITAYINERGEVIDPTESYTEDTRIWSVSKSDGSQTFYVRYGDWFAWFCSIVTLGLLLIGFWYGKNNSEYVITDN